MENKLPITAGELIELLKKSNPLAVVHVCVDYWSLSPVYDTAIEQDGNEIGVFLLKISKESEMVKYLNRDLDD